MMLKPAPAGRALAAVLVTVLAAFNATRTARAGPATGPVQVPPAANSVRARVDLGKLPPGWVSDEEKMDPHWEALKLTGTNYYAFGGRIPPNQFAARSDPTSPLYQAWFGVYAVNGGREIFETADSASEFTRLLELTLYDQNSWLAAMGDPHPVTVELSHSSLKAITIDGAPRTVYAVTISSHSDFNPPGPKSTPLAKAIGMPALGSLRIRVSPFHPITLQGLYSFWYDATRNITFVVYAVSSSFMAADGSSHDNRPALHAQLRAMAEGVRVVDNP